MSCMKDILHNYLLCIFSMFCFSNQITVLLIMVAHVNQMTGSPHHPSVEQKGVVPGPLLLHRLDEISKSVKVWAFSFLYIAATEES